jgi:hypothetical protein
MVLRLSYWRVLRRTEASRPSLASVGSTGARTGRSGAFELANAASRIGATLWCRCLLLCRFSDAGVAKQSPRSGSRRPKSAKARNRRVGHRQCSGGYGDFAAASVLGRLSRNRQFGRFGLKLRRAWRFERADRTLRHGIFGEIAGQSCKPARAGVLPGETRP